MRAMGPVVLLAVAACLALSDARLPAQPRERVFILGFDGMDPDVAERLMASGKLPNLAWMKEHGAMRRLQTTNPAQSPVAWSAFSTGMNPGKTGIYDFLRRNPDTYYPDFSTVTIQRAKFVLGFLPVRAPSVTNNRKGTTFWSLASSRGARTAVLEAPVNFPPERLQNGVLLSGLGVPDIRGTMGTFSFWATNVTTVGDTEMGGIVARIDVDGNGRARSVVHGPRNPLAKRNAAGRTPDLTLPVAFRRLRDPGPTVEISLQGRVQKVRQGAWSEWYPLAFDVAPMVAVHGLARFHVVEAFPELRIYLSPINFDPRRPPMAISSPPSYSAELAERNGIYKTLGWPEDTWALNEDKIDERIFLEDLNDTFERQRLLLFDALDRMKPDLFVDVFQATDKVQHMFWRLIDPEHPMYNARLAARYGDAIDRVYMRADSLVGQVLERCRDDRTTLLVVSDHGFSSFRKAVNLNTWLVRNGYMTLSSTDPVRDRNLDDLFGRGTFWPNVDWSRTRAYALALGQIYVNVRGRERDGIVAPGAEYEGIRREIVERLGALQDDETGAPVVRHIYTREEVYHGPYASQGPDLVVGFEKGYRVSWQTSLGGIPRDILEPNERRWSADHCSVDPEHVPGVLFSSRPLGATEAAIIDVAPTVLRRLGISPPAEMDGRDLELR